MPPGQGALENPMTLWRRLLAFIASVYTRTPAEDELVTDTTVETAAPVAAAAPVAPTVSVEAVQAAVAQAAATEAAPASAALDTDKLKAILAVLGHDLEAVWDDAVALAKKAI